MIQATRLIKLAEFLEGLEPGKFDFRHIRSKCGTNGCAIGWMPSIFGKDGWEFGGKGTYVAFKEKVLITDDAIKFFGINHSSYWFLFEPARAPWRDYEKYYHNNLLPGSATALQVAARIRKFVDYKLKNQAKQEYAEMCNFAPKKKRESLRKANRWEELVTL
jgi:hypothetical protein